MPTSKHQHQTFCCVTEGHPWQATAAIFHYINDFYNARRCHSSLSNISPLAFEARTITSPQRCCRDHAAPSP
ncbi:IS3 family transposase [Acetobacter sp.]|uniref:IS3 family transposase n=1 Tax=Acetobacter sp. TaxID=440 RepID=UPI0039E805D0